MSQRDTRSVAAGVVAGLAVLWTVQAFGQDLGGIRGAILDKDFQVPVGTAKVAIIELNKEVTGTDQGNYAFTDVPPGKYTLRILKDGYARRLLSDVLVQAGQITEVNVALEGDFAELEEFVVQEVKLGGGTEEGLIALRFESPQLLDSISSSFMSQAGASDAAAALRLVAGATVQDGKFAVIRGLPDRYVNSQMNGVRLPTADPDKRAVQLDQFPSTVIESIQVSKTFTPDQQGDASGGAVNVVLRGIPQETIFQFSTQYSYNTNAPGDGKYLTYRGGGVSYFGIDDGGRHQPSGNPDPKVVGVTRGDAPQDYKWSLAGGGKVDMAEGVKFGGFANFFYEQSSSSTDGVNDSYWVTSPGAKPTPQFSQGTPSQGDFKTSLYDVQQDSTEVKWGALGSLGIESEHHAISLTYLYTRTTDDTVTLAEDTRGKEFFFPGHDPADPGTPGHEELFAAPYLRVETLQYTERETQTLQLRGKHTLPLEEMKLGESFVLLAPEIDWTLASSSSTQYRPDKRQFASQWLPLGDGLHQAFKPQANFTIGHFQEIWQDISEESTQYFINLKIPFKQWTGDKGYLKFGVFHDVVDRSFDQDSYSNLSELSLFLREDFSSYWSAVWPTQDHAPVVDPLIDVDFTGNQEIFAWYQMIDLPLNSQWNLIGGVRFESTTLTTQLTPEEFATAIVPLDDVNFDQDDILPALGVTYKPTEQVTIRGSYAQTIARPTFKELTPIIQQEFLGGDVFIGNPELTMSALKNYDLRIDYNPYEGGLVSLSYFYKDITDPIENVQVVGDIGGAFPYTTPQNYPEGTLSGFEFEVRQKMGKFVPELEGLVVGGNVTLIHSSVTLPAEEAAAFDDANVQAPMATRGMTNAPDYLYNLFLTYEYDTTGTQFGIFYTVRGDALIAGATVDKGNFVPSVYEKEFGTLNLSVTQKIGKYVKVKFQAKNLTDPRIQEVYRSKYIGSDVIKTSYTKGIELSIGISAEIPF